MHLHLNIGHASALSGRAARARKRRNRRLRPVRPSHRAELVYRFALRQVVAELRAAGHEIAEGLEHTWGQRGDAGPDKAPGLLARARAKFARFREAAIGLAARTVSLNLSAVDDRLADAVEGSVGINVRQFLTQSGPIAEAVETATEANVALITSIPDEYFDRLEETISNSWTAGDRWEDLVEDIQHIGDVTESRAELIARDQTSKMTSAFNRARQTSLGIERYEWQTAEDDRVRESHADLDGKVFSWDDPPIVDGEPANPGEPINCRCVAAPVIDLDEDEQGEQPDGETFAEAA